MKTTELLAAHGETLAELAAASIAHGWRTRKPLSVQLGELPPALGDDAACFVTLKRAGELRGCIGTMEAWRPLAHDVVGNAHAAAFLDPRFRALRPDELPGLTASVAVLTPKLPMEFDGEPDLLAQLRPGVDGLLIEDAGKRATFLPAVWDQLPTASEFLGFLKRKAGLGATYWSPHLKAWRYTTEALEIPDFEARLRAAHA